MTAACSPWSQRKEYRHFPNHELFYSLLFFFNDTATTEIYTLSLHDALPISPRWILASSQCGALVPGNPTRSEEHTSELQSRENLVCRLLLEKKNKKPDA